MSGYSEQRCGGPPNYSFDSIERLLTTFRSRAEQSFVGVANPTVYCPVVLSFSLIPGTTRSGKR